MSKFNICAQPSAGGPINIQYDICVIENRCHIFELCSYRLFQFSEKRIFFK